MVTVALWVRLEAKPGQEAAVERFLKDGLSIVQEEPATTAWFAIRMGQSTFGIFDAFPDDAGRQAHLQGRVAAALGQKAGELLAKPPSIEKIDVLAAKLPGKASPSRSLAKSQQEGVRLRPPGSFRTARGAVSICLLLLGLQILVRLQVHNERRDL